MIVDLSNEKSKNGDKDVEKNSPKERSKVVKVAFISQK